MRFVLTGVEIALLIPTLRSMMEHIQSGPFLERRRLVALLADQLAEAIQPVEIHIRDVGEPQKEQTQ